jgi:hypothetical protein
VDDLRLFLRDEAKLPDLAIVVRGGTLKRDAVEKALQISEQQFGVSCLSVCAHAAFGLRELWMQTPNLSRYSKARASDAGTLRARGFVLLPTFAAPHYSLVMPRVDIWQALEECFTQYDREW